ncbi:hypothetical protein Scep_017194 [Stephania cephalantha]|uniref:Uncharacterized protein n=1 Tax=Stephania cephalantha TaxID=152367 RepID=A0AAP0IQV5_9MAGN
MKELNRPVSLKPIGEDRAVLFCTSENERQFILRRAEGISGDLIEKLCPWRAELHWDEPHAAALMCGFS